MPVQETVGTYLLKRLEQAGLKHIFGVPGDYVLGFINQIVASPIQFVGTCTEAGAGFAADGYARVNGLGAACVTYCVGGFNVLNSVAGAYAEKSPLILISGAPGTDELTRSPLLHHRVRDFNTQRLIFEKVTAMAVALEDPRTAPQQIEEALAVCLRQKRPIYIELPRDIVSKPCGALRPLALPVPASNKDALREAVAESAAMLGKARRPAILAGVEMHRFGLQEQLIQLVEGSGFPVAATLLGKSVISEQHPQYLGVYVGAMGGTRARQVIEGADCLLILGAFMSDINLGINSARLEPARAIYATSERISIRHHHYEEVLLPDFLNGLGKALGGPIQPKAARKPRPPLRPFKAQPARKLKVKRLFERMNHFIQDDSVVICDPGDSLFAAIDLQIHRRTEFLSPAYYTSMGFAVPAALGVQIRDPRRHRPLVFVGDGAFQMSGQELSTIARNGLNPIIFVLNNKGYTTERFLSEGPYNDIQNWAYHLYPELIGSGWGCEVHTEGELEAALEHARANQRGLSLLNLHLEPYDKSEALARLGARLGKLVDRKK